MLHTEKDPSILEHGHGHTVSAAGDANGAIEELRIDSVSETSPVAQEDAADVHAPSHDHPHQSPEIFRTPSPSSRSFGALSAASSPSPDPDDMAAAPAPSLAEMVAKTINSVYTSSHEGEAGPSSVKVASDSGQTRRPSVGRVEETRHSPAASLGKRKSAEPPTNSAPRSLSRTNSRPPSSQSHRTTARSRSRSAPAQNPSSSTPAVATPALSPIPESENTSVLQNGVHNDVQMSNGASSIARPFRSGSIRLEPDPPPEETADSGPQGNNVQPQNLPLDQVTSMQPEECERSFESASIPTDDTDMLSSSLDPSIPAFTQTFDVHSQSQWPLATQAPYSFDSQLAFSSQ